jgi:hypothetical protein
MQRNGRSLTGISQAAIDPTTKPTEGRNLLNLVSLIIGAVALVCAAIAFIPLLGWANWLIIPLAVIGAGIGAVSSSNTGRNLNLFVIVVGIVRLMIGGGIL